MQAFFQGKPGDEVDFPMVYHCRRVREAGFLSRNPFYRDKRCKTAPATLSISDEFPIYSSPENSR